MRVTEIPKRERGKPKVCAYVRVSSNSEEQEDSFLFQSRYWERKFINDSTVEYVGLFSDNGVSGKSMKNRKGLNKMLELARNGGADMIYTKSVSRFARNYAEAITIIRELRDIGVPIIFEKENINTLDPKCELILSVMASLAEEELRSMSENQKWAVRKRFAEGKPDCSRTYGYRVVNNHLVIDQTEAIGVRRIYELYLQGYGATKIAQILDAEGIKTLKDGAWSSMSVRGILFYEVYIGDHLLQKNVYNMKSRHKNDGELPQYYVQDTHEREYFQKYGKRNKRNPWQRSGVRIRVRYQGKRNSRVIIKSPTAVVMTAAVGLFCGKCNCFKFLHVNHFVDIFCRFWYNC